MSVSMSVFMFMSVPYQFGSVWFSLVQFGHTYILGSRFDHTDSFVAAPEGSEVLALGNAERHDSL